MKLIQSTVEQSAWLVVFLVVVALAVEIPAVIHIIHHQDLEQQQIKQSVQDIQKHEDCIVDFFLQPNRLNITAANLKVCAEVIKK